MRNIKLLAVAVIAVIVMTACQCQFNGSRTGNENNLYLSYSVLNKTDYQMLKLTEGDVVVFDIVSTAGKVNITLQKGENEPVFTGENLDTSNFTVDIDESGEYKCTVTGINAKGSVSVKKENK